MSKLQEIILQKQKEVTHLYENIAYTPQLAEIMQEKHLPKIACSFKQAMSIDSLSIIAEIKRRSPSKGELATISDPLALAADYIGGGAHAISVLTDEKFFGGNIDDLAQVSNYAAQYKIPTLRKDFIIDVIQIAEAALSGASAILLIVAAVGNNTKKLLDFAHGLKLDVLVEVHAEAELEIALAAGADIIGVNNRNLKSLEVNPEFAFSLVEKIPTQIIKIAESGIVEPDLAKRYHAAGFNAVLIGESLVKSKSPKKFIEACHG